MAKYLEILILLSFAVFKICALSDGMQFYFDENNLIEYIDSIQNKINFDANKCDDFVNFSCGKTKVNDVTTYSIDKFVQKYFIDNKEIDEIERKVGDMYISLEKHSADNNEITPEVVDEILKQINDVEFKPMHADVSVNDITYILTNLLYLDSGFNGPILFGIACTRRECEDLKIYPLNLSTHYIQLNKIDIIKIMESQNLIDEIKEVLDFINNYEKILNEVDEDDFLTFDSIEHVKKALKTKTYNWNELIPSVRKIIGLKKTQIVIKNVNMLKKLLQLIDSTKKSTIYNFYLCNFIITLSKYRFRDFDHFYRFPVLSHVWNNQFNDSMSNQRMLIFFDEFQTVFEELNNTELCANKTKYNYLKAKLNIYANIYENYRLFYAKELRNSIYENIDIDPEKFYKNALTVTKMYMINGQYFFHATSNFEFENQIYDEIVDVVFSPLLRYFKNKPFIYLYTNVVPEIFKYILSRRNIVNKLRTLNELADEEKLNSDYNDIEKNLIKNVILTKDFQQTIEAYNFAMKIFEKVSNNTNTIVNAELNYFNEINKNYTELSLANYGLIGLFQNYCENDMLKRAQNLEKYLKIFGVFSKQFNCPKSTKNIIFEKFVNSKNIKDIFYQ